MIKTLWISLAPRVQPARRILGSLIGLTGLIALAAVTSACHQSDITNQPGSTSQEAAVSETSAEQPSAEPRHGTTSEPDETDTGAVLVAWSDVLALPQPEAGLIYRYGEHDDQYAELFVPTQADPAAGGFPVVALFHGGCWLEAFDATYMRPLARRLTDLGYAVWNIEYRRVRAGDAGRNEGAGGYPHTFTDISAAMDMLRSVATEHRLDLSRVVAMGHSAGGHLALWSALRGQLPADSTLKVETPLLPARVIGLAAIADLRSYRVGPPNSCHAAVDVLIGGSPDAQATRYAETSPLDLFPMPVPTALINGVQDPIVSIDSAQAAARADRSISVTAVDGLGHFGLAMTSGRGWDAIKEALGQAPN